MTVRVRVRQVSADRVEMCRDIDNVAVHGRWPLTTGVAQGRFYCIAEYILYVNFYSVVMVNKEAITLFSI